MTSYEKFLGAINKCTRMAENYLKKCYATGRVDPDNKYYFDNLLAFHIDPESGLPRILCSNTDPNDRDEATHSYNIRFIDIDQELFNRGMEEIDKDYNLDEALNNFISKMDREDKLNLYDQLKTKVK